MHGSQRLRARAARGEGRDGGRAAHRAVVRPDTRTQGKKWKKQTQQHKKEKKRKKQNS